MTYIEAIYGAQYEELQQQGKDGHKARFNGNLLLSALIVLIALSTLMLVTLLLPEIELSLNGIAQGWKIKTLAMIIAMPAWALSYFLITKTVGSVNSFQGTVARYMKYPDAVRKKANLKALLPVFLVCALLLVLSFSGLKR